MDSKQKQQLKESLVKTAIYAAIAVVYMFIFALLSPKFSNLWLAVILIFLYLATMAAVYFVYHRKDSKEESSSEEISATAYAALSLDLTQKVSSPIIICSADGKFAWGNGALVSIFQKKSNLFGRHFDSLSSVSLETVMTHESQNGVKLFLGEAENRFPTPYFAKGYSIVSKGKSYSVVVCTDITAIETAEQILDDDRAIVAYAMIDNVEELIQQVQELYRTASNEVENIIKRHINQAGGIVKQYEKDKYICVFRKKHLPEFIENKFALLDEIREIHLGDTNMVVTISMGIACVSGSLADKEMIAKAALDMALQRGGDQAVLRTDDETEYFGGRSKTTQKRTKVRSRVVAKDLIHLMSQSDNVIVMGHKFADFDAFAACCAIVEMARFCGVKAYAVVNKNDTNLRVCFDALENNPMYKGVFVDSIEAQDLIQSESLVCLVDVNNLSHCEAPDIVLNAHKYVVIDHHRKTAEYETKPNIEYIEPSASSASELLSEMLEHTLPQGKLGNSVANLLFSGILLDTKQFTRSTGIRTFSAALYLRGEGASPAEAKNMFRSELSEFTSEAKFESNVVMHRSIFAIALNDSPTNPAIDKISAAKAADKLLTVKGIEASFAICRIGSQISISARSQGKINVQLILEKLGGGGHFDAAGAAIEYTSVAEALTRLRDAIDEYLEETGMLGE